jgi:quercetin dioxygenase-like cupin family protein
MKSVLALIAAAVVAAAGFSQGSPKETVVVRAADVKWGDHPFVKGAQMCVQHGDPAKGPSVLMMKFPKGLTIPAHWHTSDEAVTVVSGSAVFGSGETVDASKGTELGAGSYITIPGTNPHWAVVKSDLVITATLTTPADFHACGEKK